MRNKTQHAFADGIVCSYMVEQGSCGCPEEAAHDATGSVSTVPAVAAAMVPETTNGASMGEFMGTLFLLFCAPFGAVAIRAHLLLRLLGGLPTTRALGASRPPLAHPISIIAVIIMGLCFDLAQPCPRQSSNRESNPFGSLGAQRVSWPSTWWSNPFA